MTDSDQNGYSIIYSGQGSNQKTKNPEEKLTESFQKLLKVSEEVNESSSRSCANEGSVTSEDSLNQVLTVPEENKIEPAPRDEPLKSVVSPDYVRKVMRELDTMSAEMLRQALSAIRVSTNGTKRQLRKRVAQYYRKENILLNRKMDVPSSDKTFRYFDYLIAIDFECTCVEVIYDYPHEIIELPAVLIDVKEMKIVSMFRTYVRPVKNPILSDFCIDFTKITQETVNKAPYFREALQLLFNWMRRFGLGDKGVRFAFVTDGPHDMWKFMQFQCMLSGMKMPHMFRSFINIKKIFKDRFHGITKGNGKSGIENMLAKFDLKFEGNKHSGLDDAKNIAYICLEMMKRRIELRINQKCTYRMNTSSVADDEEDEVRDKQYIDISRRDFQMWMRKLPLKLQSVSRREFLNEEYLDCESCDELIDDQNELNSFEQKMSAREEIGRRVNVEFESFPTDFSQNIANSEEIRQITNLNLYSTSDSDSEWECADNEQDDDDEDQNVQSWNDERVASDEDVWRRDDGSLTMRNRLLYRNRHDFAPSSIESTSSTSTLVNARHCRRIPQVAPRNSLASTSYRN